MRRALLGVESGGCEGALQPTTYRRSWERTSGEEALDGNRGREGRGRLLRAALSVGAWGSGKRGDVRVWDGSDTNADVAELISGRMGWTEDEGAERRRCRRRRRHGRRRVHLRAWWTERGGSSSVSCSSWKSNGPKATGGRASYGARDGSSQLEDVVDRGRLRERKAATVASRNQESLSRVQSTANSVRTPPSAAFLRGAPRRCASPNFEPPSRICPPDRWQVVAEAGRHAHA